MSKKKSTLDEYIKYLIEYFQPRMGLGLYDIRYKWVARVGKPKGGYNIAYDPDGFAAQVAIDYVYYDMMIYLNKNKLLKKWRAFDFFYIASTVIHEMAHAYTEQLYNELWEVNKKKSKIEREHYRQINEQTVERITKVILSSHKQEAWMPRAI